MKKAKDETGNKLKAHIKRQHNSDSVDETINEEKPSKQLKRYHTIDTVKKDNYMLNRLSTELLENDFSQALLVDKSNSVSKQNKSNRKLKVGTFNAQGKFVYNFEHAVNICKKNAIDILFITEPYNMNFLCNTEKYPVPADGGVWHYNAYGISEVKLEKVVVIYNDKVMLIEDSQVSTGGFKQAIQVSFTEKTTNKTFKFIAAHIDYSGGSSGVASAGVKNLFVAGKKNGVDIILGDLNLYHQQQQGERSQMRRSNSFSGHYSRGNTGGTTISGSKLDAVYYSTKRFKERLIAGNMSINDPDFMPQSVKNRSASRRASFDMARQSDHTSGVYIELSLKDLSPMDDKHK